MGAQAPRQPVSAAGFEDAQAVAGAQSHRVLIWRSTELVFLPGPRHVAPDHARVLAEPEHSGRTLLTGFSNLFAFVVVFGVILTAARLIHIVEQRQAAPFAEPFLGQIHWQRLVGAAQHPVAVEEILAARGVRVARRADENAR